MATKVFLSLSYVDRDFVADVRRRLPGPIAYFYEESFDNGENLLSAMERVAKDAAIFVLFASPEGLKSPWVQFEIEQARIQHIKNPNHRILVFPTSPDLNFRMLPEWLRDCWITKAGWTPSDVARYITGVLLEPNSDFSAGATKVVGRGRTTDKLERIVADHVSQHRRAPSVFFLSGFRGIGRKTFAGYFMRSAMAASANLVYGPPLHLSGSADLSDIHHALRTDITPNLPPERLAKEREVFGGLEIDAQIDEIHKLLKHFSDLGQAVTIVSSGGFFEDTGEPKSWFLPLIDSIKPEQTLFLVSNRQIDPRLIEGRSTIVQMRVEELDDKDIKALMIFTSQRLGVENFEVSAELIRAIGGHADIANAAVRLARIKGTHILNRDPRQLFSVQNTILGESVAPENLTETERYILCLLSWVPKLSGNLLEKILLDYGVPVDDQIKSLENLILGCLVIPVGPDHTISSAIRLLYRRFNITPPDLLAKFSAVLSKEWQDAKDKGEFRVDLFESFIFMHALEGKALPTELRRLLTPGMLADVVQSTYARGKEEGDDKELLERAVQWGEIAEQINMSEATREDILSVVVRARIRLGQFQQAKALIDQMQAKRYRSVPFLLGHMYRRSERYKEAIEYLLMAVDNRKFSRSAVHELALSYKKSGHFADLRALLERHGALIRDSAMFADFQIGVDLARGQLEAAETGIEHLRGMPDDEGKSDIRHAQLLMRRLQYDRALGELNNLLEHQGRNDLRVRCIRATCASRLGQFEIAQKDVEFLKRSPAWAKAGIRLEAGMLIDQRRPLEARELLKTLQVLTAEDWLSIARANEVEADLPETLLQDAQKLRIEAAEIRAKNNFALEYEFGD